MKNTKPEINKYAHYYMGGYFVYVSTCKKYTGVGILDNWNLWGFTCGEDHNGGNYEVDPEWAEIYPLLDEYWELAECNKRTHRELCKKVIDITGATKYCETPESMEMLINCRIDCFGLIKRGLAKRASDYMKEIRMLDERITKERNKA